MINTMATQITDVSIVCRNICSCTYQRKHQSSVSLAFMGNDWWPVDSPNKGPVMWNFHTMTSSCSDLVFQTEMIFNAEWYMSSEVCCWCILWVIFIFVIAFMDNTMNSCEQWISIAAVNPALSCYYITQISDSFSKILSVDQNVNKIVTEKTCIKLINVLQTYPTIEVDNAGVRGKFSKQSPTHFDA